LKKGDLISIALNTSNIPLYYDGHLSTLEDVVWTFSLVVLATGDVVPLTLEGTKLKFKDRMRKEILSWAIYPDQTLLDQRLPIMDPNTITQATREYIELDLLIFASLPSAPTAESLELSTQIITQHRLEPLAREFLATADHQARRTIHSLLNALARDQSDSPDILSRFYQVWLAQAVDCGIDWILRLPETLREGTDQTWLYGTMGETSDDRLTAAASTLYPISMTRKGRVIRPRLQTSSTQ
jgi:hypothetical protein